MIEENRNTREDITDTNGNTTKYYRDKNNNTTLIGNPDGSEKEYQYDSKNNIVKTKDESGKLTYFFYDNKGAKLLKKVQPLYNGETYSENANQNRFAITTYEYYPDSEYKIKGLLKSITDAEGNKTEYSYNRSTGNILIERDFEETQPNTVIMKTEEWK